MLEKHESVKCNVHSLHNKQLLDLFTMICKTIIVEVIVISQAKGKVNNSYLNIVYYAFQTKKKQIQ